MGDRLARYRAGALAFAAYLVIQAVSAAALFVLKLGGDASGVRGFYLGSEARFTAAKSLDGILEVAVPHLVAIPLVLFAAIHVIGFARVLPPRVFSALVTVSFASGLAGVLSGFAVRWLAPGFAWIKIAAFAGMETALLSWATALLAVFAPRRSRAQAPPQQLELESAKEAVR